MYLHMMKLSSGTVVFFFIIFFICCTFTITYPFGVRVSEPPPPFPPSGRPVRACAHGLFRKSVGMHMPVSTTVGARFSGNYPPADTWVTSVTRAQHYASFPSECPKLPSIRLFQQLWSRVSAATNPLQHARACTPERENE